jgi:hypothetical protein
MSHRGYKKSAPSDDDETKMTPVPNFTSEISLDSGEIKSGDVKCVSRILGDGEEIPEGSFGSFIPQNRPSLAQKVDELMENMEKQNAFNKKQRKNMKKQKLINKDQSRQIEALQVENITFRRENAKLKEMALLKLQNLMVQYMRQVQKELLCRRYPDLKTHFDDIEINFANLENLLPKEQLIEFRRSEEYKAIQNISGRGSLFQSIKELRNNDIYPENINIVDIQLLQNYLGTDGNFDPSNQELFDDINTVLDNLSSFKVRFGMP